MLHKHSVPTQLTAYYADLDDQHVHLCIAGHNGASMTLEIIHASTATSATTYALPGNQATEHMAVRDGDLIVIVAHRDEATVGAGIYEINVASMSVGYVLVAQAESKIILNQQQMDDDQCHPSPALAATRGIEDQIRKVLRDLDAHHDGEVCS